MPLFLDAPPPPAAVAEDVDKMSPQIHDGPWVIIPIYKVSDTVSIQLPTVYGWAEASLPDPKIRPYTKITSTEKFGANVTTGFPWLGERVSWQISMPADLAEVPEHLLLGRTLRVIATGHVLQPVGTRRTPKAETHQNEQGFHQPGCYTVTASTGRSSATADLEFVKETETTFKEALFYPDHFPAVHYQAPMDDPTPTTTWQIAWQKSSPCTPDNAKPNKMSSTVDLM